MFDQRLLKPHFKSVIFASYLGLLKEEYPTIDLKQLVAEAGLSLEYIEDENSWVSIEFEKRLMDLILEKTGDKEIHFKAGRFGVTRTGLGTALYFLASNIIPLDAIYKSLPKLTGLLNKVVKVEVAEFRRGNIKLIFKPNTEDLNLDEVETIVSRMPLIMENTKGYYSGIPTVKNLPPATADVQVVDAKNGIYALDLSYFPQSQLLSVVIKLSPIFLTFILTVLLFKIFNIGEVNAFMASAVVSSLVTIGYLTHKNWRLKQISIQTEESLFRLDRQYKDLYYAQSKLRRKLNESQAIFQLVSHLNSAAEESHAIQLGCESFVENLDYDRAFILLYDKEEKVLRLAASKGLSPHLKEVLGKLKLPIEVEDDDPARFTNVFRFKKPLLVKSVKEHISKLKDPTSMQILELSGTISFVAAPIYTQSSTLGILVADSVTRHKIMTEDDLRLISTGAQQIAIAIEQQRSKQELVDAYLKEQMLSVSYSRFVPFETLKILNYKEIFDVRLGDGVEENVAIMFSDIRGFTTLCETMTPTEILKFLNSYYARLSPIIKAQGGTIDKYMGDGVMAIFPNPEMALKAALEIQRTLLLYNVQNRVGSRVPIKAGIGIAAGRVVFGPLGSENRLEIAAISDTVNVASRLEGLCRSESEDIMISGISEESLAKIPGIRIKKYEPMKVKGKLREIEVVSVVDTKLFSEITGSEFSDQQKVYLCEQKERWQKKMELSFQPDVVETKIERAG